MLPTIFLASHISADLRRQLAACGQLLDADTPDLAEAVAKLTPVQCQAINILLAVGSLRMSAEVLARLPRLQLICCVGSGYDGVDLAYTRQQGIGVTNNPSANAASVADLAMGLVISSVRNFPQARQYLESGHWQGNAGNRMPSVRGLTGRRLGVCGFGAIGQRVAQRAAAFDLEVGYHSRQRRPDSAYGYHASLLALAHWADILVVCLRADTSTYHAINAEVLAALGPDGFLINVSRGSTVDEAALLAALQQGHLAGAGLDVYAHEPKVPAELFQLPHVTLTPHIGGSTLEAAKVQEAGILANIQAYLRGQPLLTPVSLSA